MHTPSRLQTELRFLNSSAPPSTLCTCSSSLNLHTRWERKWKLPGCSRTAALLGSEARKRGWPHSYRALSLEGRARVAEPLTTASSHDLAHEQAGSSGLAGKALPGRARCRRAGLVSVKQLHPKGAQLKQELTRQTPQKLLTRGNARHPDPIRAVRREQHPRQQ